MCAHLLFPPLPTYFRYLTQACKPVHPFHTLCITTPPPPPRRMKCLCHSSRKALVHLLDVPVSWVMCTVYSAQLKMAYQSKVKASSLLSENDQCVRATDAYISLNSLKTSDAFLEKDAGSDVIVSAEWPEQKKRAASSTVPDTKERTTYGHANSHADNPQRKQEKGSPTLFI